MTAICQKKNKWMRAWLRKNAVGYAFLMPFLVLFAIFVIVPVGVAMYYSLTNYNMIQAPKFVGLSNYAMIWSDNTFTHAFWFTAVFTVVSTVLINVLAFGIALLLTRGIRGTNIFRTTFFMPNLIGGIILGYIWQILLNGVLSALEKPLLSLNARTASWALSF